MVSIIRSLLTAFLTRRVLQLVILELIDWYVKKSNTKLDDSIWKQVRRELNGSQG